MTQALLSVEQAAQRLGGVSRWSIYSWLSQGRLRKTKVGGRVMIAEADLQAFIASCNPPALPSPKRMSAPRTPRAVPVPVAAASPAHNRELYVRSP
jgi:excisionase family DNA binding protein